MIDVRHDRKVIIFAVICILVLGGLVVVNFLTQQQSTKTSQNPIPTQAPKKKTASLTLVTSNSTVSVGESFLVEVQVDTNENSAGGIQLEASYNPAFLAIDSMKVGTFFTNPISYSNKIDFPTKGQLQFAIGAIQPKKGTGTVIEITAHALAKTQTSQEVMTIKPSSLITEPKNNQSVLAEMKGLTLVIQ